MKANHKSKPERKKLTPPELAAQWGLSADKIIEWIRRGELRAINVATRAGRRPRFLIDLIDIAEFEARRQFVPSAPAPRRKRRTTDGIVEFF
jgi:hypothetical protein